jgi:hypothetical protein
MMNERIRELAEQAGYKPLPGLDFANSIQEIYTQKFAELIVRECIDIADDYVKDYCVEEHIKYNHPKSKIGLKIKEHFGIENKENT